MKLELTRKTDLAVRAMQALHAADSRLPGRKLADHIGTTTPFISQVVTPLVQAGLLDSRPGPTGGYGLVANPRKVTMLEVVELIEGPIDNGRCVLAGGPCDDREFCSIHDAWIEARAALRLALAQVTVVTD